MFETGTHIYGKKIRSNNGMGGYTLCINCNTETGAWYANDFADLTKQGMRILSGYDNPGMYVAGYYEIKPLNVLKQILTMFLSADKSGFLRSDMDLVSFIKDKYNQILPDRYSIYIYSNASNMKRQMGYMQVYDGSNKIHNWSEINFKPFGYFLTDNSSPPHAEMTSITSFKKYAYNEIKKYWIPTKYLKVNSPIIGTYSK
jgi:hypothetical protein